MGSRTLNLLQQLSLQHIMVSKLCTDFTATLHLSPGLYTSYFRLSWFMSILYIMCASCVFHIMHDFLACYSHLSRCNSHLPCHRSFLRSSTEDARKPRKAHRRARPQEEAEEKGEKEPNVAANIAFLNCCIVFPSCC